MSPISCAWRHCVVAAGAGAVEVGRIASPGILLLLLWQQQQPQGERRPVRTGGDCGGTKDQAGCCCCRRKAAAAAGRPQRPRPASEDGEGEGRGRRRRQANTEFNIQTELLAAGKTGRSVPLPLRKGERDEIWGTATRRPRCRPPPPPGHWTWNGAHTAQFSELY